MKFIRSKTKKLPPVAKKTLLPREEFIAKGKDRFLAAYDASALAANTRTEHPSGSSMFFRIGIGAMAVLCVAGGLSAYADTANVPTTNPLYSLKRLGENVQLEFTSTSRRPQLQATFAVRRANEIAALQTSQPSSTLIPELTSNLDQDIQGSLGVSASAVLEATSTATSTTTTISTLASASSSLPSSSVAGSISVYCGAFDVSTSGVLMGQLESRLLLRSDALEQFNKQCGYDESNTNNSDTNTQPTHHRTWTPSSTLINTSTTASSSFEYKEGHHHQLDGATTTSVAVTSTITSTVNIHLPAGL